MDFIFTLPSSFSSSVVARAAIGMSAASESDTAANSAALDLIEFLFLP